MVERVEIRDKDGLATGKTKRRYSSYRPDEYHLVVEVWITNGAGQVLMQKRAEEKSRLAGSWCATTGCVMAGDTALETASREVAEELGIAAEEGEFTYLRRIVSHPAIWEIFALRCELPVSALRLQVEEVAAVRWVSPETVLELAKTGEAFSYPEMEEVMAQACDLHRTPGALPKPVIETERLILREMTPEDRGDLCEYLQDPIAMTAYEHAFSDNEVDEWLSRQLLRYRTEGFGAWAMVRKDTGEMIGQAGVTYQPIGYRRVLEIGYLMKRRHWGGGYAAEAAAASVDFVLRHLGRERVCAIVRDSNLASQRVAIRVGLLPRERFVKYYHGVDMPHIVFWSSPPR